MAETHFLSGLKERRSDFLGQVEAVRRQIIELEAREQELLNLLSHVDRLLVHEAPDLSLDTVKARRPRGPHPRSGSGSREDSVSRAALDTLRRSDSAMTVDEISERIASGFGRTPAKQLKQNIRAALSNAKKLGLLTAQASASGLLAYETATANTTVA